MTRSLRLLWSLEMLDSHLAVCSKLVYQFTTQMNSRPMAGRPHRDSTSLSYSIVIYKTQNCAGQYVIVIQEAFTLMTLTLNPGAV
jgi:hypothetical protein